MYTVRYMIYYTGIVVVRNVTLNMLVQLVENFTTFQESRKKSCK
jgi:hypothetical protein